MMERNEALLRKVGDVIAAEPERYDQSITADECGTVGCIAGHAVMLTYPDKSPGEILKSTAITLAAEEALGLDPVESSILFYANWQPAGSPSVPLHGRVREALYRLAEGDSVEDVTA